MSKRLPLADFRAVRHKLESHEFAISEGEDVAPTQLIDKKTWAGITHLSDDVAIRTSDHNGHRLELLYSLWGDWIMATGDPEKSDELFDCMLDAGDAFQCTNFLFLHGYYRGAMGELRLALELRLLQKVPMVLVRGRSEEPGASARLLVTPSRPGLVLSYADDHQIPVATGVA